MKKLAVISVLLCLFLTSCSTLDKQNELDNDKSSSGVIKTESFILEKQESNLQDTEKNSTSSINDTSVYEGSGDNDGISDMNSDSEATVTSADNINGSTVQYARLMLKSPYSTRELLFEYDGQLSSDVIIRKISEETGIALNTNSVVRDGNKLIIDFSDESYFYSGNIDQQKLEESVIRFFDVDTMIWFALDSIDASIKKNLYITDIYFTHNGDTFSPPKTTITIPATEAYRGSEYYNS